MSKIGIFITVEGADGAGKSSAIEHIKQQFVQNDEKVLTTREPGGTWVAEAIRNIVINEDPNIEVIDPVVQTLLFLAARLQHVKRVILPALHRGEIVICDRYLDSTHVLQGLLKSQSTLLIQFKSVTGLNLINIRPDYTLFLDVSHANSIARSKSRGMNGLDKQHTQVDTTALFRDHFQQVLTALGRNRIKTIDANRGVQEVLAQITLACEEIKGHRYSSLSAPGVNGFAHKAWHELSVPVRHVKGV